MRRFEVIHGDGLELLRGLPDGSASAVITDPPYGLLDCEWDQAPDWRDLFREAHRVVGPRGTVVVFCTLRVGLAMIQANRSRFRYDLVWAKNRPIGFLNARKMPLRDHELILVFGERAGTYNPQMTTGERYVARRKPGRVWAGYSPTRSCQERMEYKDRHPRSVLRFALDRPCGHPTAKPVDLLRWLVRTYTNPGELVVDPFMGAGSCALACQSEGREFVGSDLHEPFLEIARRRLSSG